MALCDLKVTSCACASIPAVARRAEPVGYWAWSPGVVAIASSGGIGVGGEEGGGANGYEGWGRVAIVGRRTSTRVRWWWITK